MLKICSKCGKKFDTRYIDVCVCCDCKKEDRTVICAKCKKELIDGEIIAIFMGRYYHADSCPESSPTQELLKEKECMNEQEKKEVEESIELSEEIVRQRKEAIRRQEPFWS